MPDISPITRERLAISVLVWLAAFTSLWIGSPLIRKAVASMLWQLYDLFIGKRVP